MLDLRPKGVRRAWALSSAPIHLLPDEVLAYIFQLRLQDSHESNDLYSSPRIFTHVCNRWTHVALSNKSLWSHVIMSFPLTPAQLIEANIRLMRSRPHPIDIHLDFRDPFWDWDEETHRFGISEMSTVIRALLPHIGRWRKLVLLTDTWAPIFCLLLTASCISASAPVLDTISLSRCNAYFSAEGETFKPKALRPPIKLFGGMPLEKLQSVSLVGVHVDWGGSQLVNLHQLELKYHASDVMPTLDEFMHILAACPRLTILSVIGWGPRLDVPVELKGGGDKAPHYRRLGDSGSPAALTLKHLIRFAFGFVDVNYAIELLSLFRFPALLELELEDVSLTLNPYKERNSSAVLEFLTGNRHGKDPEADSIQPIPLDQITHLELRGLCADSDAFSVFLGCAVALEHLILTDTSDEAALSLDPGSRQADNDSSILLCPNLQTLHCQDLDEEIVGRVLSSRSAVNSRALDAFPVKQSR